MLTVAQVTEALPPQIKTVISQPMVDKLNNLSTDPEAAAHIRDNFISYTNIIKQGKFTLSQYVHAVAYVTYKMMGYNNREAYSRTFPAKYQKLVSRGATSKDISAYVSIYNKTKMVNLIFEQTIISPWVLNQDLLQKALYTQADLMVNAKSEKVRSDAANSLLTHLKKPETKNFELNIGVADTSGINELKQTMLDMAKMQQDAIKNGQTTQAIAHQTILHATRSDDTVEDAEIIE